MTKQSNKLELKSIERIKKTNKKTERLQSWEKLGIA